MSCLAACTAIGALPAICEASSSARAASSPPATTSFTSPQASAFCASTGWPEKIICFARAAPISAGRRAVPPQAGFVPIVTSGSASRASSEAMRRSHASASSRPPP